MPLTIDRELWESLLGGLVGEKLRTIFKLVRSGAIDEAKQQFSEELKKGHYDIKRIELSHYDFFGKPHIELDFLLNNTPLPKMPQDLSSLNKRQSNPLHLHLGKNKTIKRRAFKKILVILDLTLTEKSIPTVIPVMTESTLISLEPSPSKSFAQFLNIKEPQPITVLLSLFLLILIGSSSSLIGSYIPEKKITSAVAGIAIKAPEILNLAEYSDQKKGVRFLYPFGMKIITEDSQIVIAPQSEKGKLMVQLSKGSVITQIEKDSAGDQEIALLEAAKAKIEESFREITIPSPSTFSR